MLKQDLFTGQQVSSQVFVPTSEAASTVAIRGTTRAVGVDVKTSNGLVGTLHDGDHVDVYAQIGSGNQRIVRKVLTNVLVLHGPDRRQGHDGRGDDAHILFALSDRDAQKMLWLADNGDNTSGSHSARRKTRSTRRPPSRRSRPCSATASRPAVQKLIKGLLNPAGATQ